MKTANQWPEALLLISAGFRSGLNIDETLQTLLDEAPEPLRTVLRKRTGSSFSRFPNEDKIRLLFSEADLGLVRASLSMGQLSGGRQADVIDTAARLLQARTEFEERVKGMTAHGRVTAWVVGLSPLLLGATLFALAPEMVQPLFETVLGRWILLFAGGLIVSGLCVVQRLSRIEA